MFITDDLRQIRALVLKSLTLQWRQWKTNVIQLLLPIACLAFIFGMQLLITLLQYTTTPEDQRDIRIDTVGVSLTAEMLITNNMVNHVGENATYSAPVSMLYHFDGEKVSESVLGDLHADGLSSYPGSLLAHGADLQLPVYDYTVAPPKLLYHLPHFERVDGQLSVNEKIIDELVSQDSRENITWAGSYEFTALDISLGSPRLEYTIQYDNRSATSFCQIVSSRSKGSCREVIPSGMAAFLHSIFASILTDGQQMISTSAKQMNYLQRFEIFKIDSIAGSFLFPMVLMLLLPVFLYTIVLEKQHKLRVMMELMGLKRRNYYIVTYVFLYGLYIAAAIEFCVLSWAFGFRFVTETNFGLTALILLLWGLSLVSMSFLLASFIGTTIVANALGFLVVLFGPVFGLIFDNFVIQKDLWYTKFFLLCSPMALLHSITEANVACGQFHCLGFDAIWNNMQIYSSLIAFAVTAVAYFVLALYFDAVLPQPWGVRKNPLFFISWIWENRNRKRMANSDDLAFDTNGMDDDVISEKNKVIKGEWNRDNTGILLDNLVKRYGRDTIAVKGVCLGFEKTGCLGLLGANGAGKTTTISMLCGLFGPSSGNAYVNGYSIKTQMDKIHLSLGLCPQFDVLWPDLTCLEHMLFYARIKGVPLKEERKHAEQLLHSVGLSRKILKRSPKAGSLSGGMKRRLSIAMSLVGNPAVVLFDEPTTGLDPKTKRHLWKVILKAKKERCCLLTTHSLVEADVLSDRIAIFSKGRLKAIGTSMHLKSKYGEGYKLTINFDEKDKEKACSYIQNMYPNARFAVDFASNVTFEIPKQDLRISDLFERLERHKSDYGIKEHGLNHVTLEDVFLALVRKDEEEEAEREEQARLDKTKKSTSKKGTGITPQPITSTTNEDVISIADPIYSEEAPAIDHRHYEV